MYKSERVDVPQCPLRAVMVYDDVVVMCRYTYVKDLFFRFSNM